MFGPPPVNAHATEIIDNDRRDRKSRRRSRSRSKSRRSRIIFTRLLKLCWLAILTYCTYFEYTLIIALVRSVPCKGISLLWKYPLLDLCWRYRFPIFKAGFPPPFVENLPRSRSHDRRSRRRRSRDRRSRSRNRRSRSRDRRRSRSRDKSRSRDRSRDRFCSDITLHIYFLIIIYNNKNNYNNKIKIIVIENKMYI